MGVYDPDWVPDEDEEEDRDDDEYEVSEEDEEEFQEFTERYAEAQDEFNNEQAEDFEVKYGFIHDCHCADDWKEGNLGVVSMCYLGMVVDALEALAERVEECKTLRKENARLLIELADAS